MGIANASAALDAGARILDGSLGGLGGNRSTGIDYVDPNDFTAVATSIEADHVATVTSIDRIEHQVEKGLLNLVGIEFALKVAVH